MLPPLPLPLLPLLLGNRMSSSMDGTPTPGTARNNKPPQNFREAITAGSVVDVGKYVRAMSDEEAEVQLVDKDR